VTAVMPTSAASRSSPSRHDPQRPSLVGATARQFHFDLLCFTRNKESIFFTFALPIVMLLIFASVFTNSTVKVPGGTVNESLYYVPAIITFGLIAANFSNLMVSVVRYREAGIYKRRRATPVAASTVIAGRGAVAVLTGLAITTILLAIGWAGFSVSIPGRTAPAFILFVVVGALVLCVLGFAVASLITEADAAQPAAQAIVLPICFISGVFIPIKELPNWLQDVGKVFPVHALNDALLAAYNPHTAGLGLNWADLAVLLGWGVAGLVVASRHFSWLPRSR
jgi:ABC-2 type transport system permease protein